jgi:very-short-patch-repair endonuclease
MLNYRPLQSGSIDRARQLRHEAPEPERRLLRAVREGFSEHKWRHQSPVGPYYVDILCFAARVAIEVDGDTHAGHERYDAARTAFIAREGFRTLRFANGDVTENIEGVLAAIGASLSRTGKGSTQ